jgi:hypothetical protein
VDLEQPFSKKKKWPPATRPSSRRDRLIKAGLIYAPSRGEVDFTVPLCADYIPRAMPETHSSIEIWDETREERL